VTNINGSAFRTHLRIPEFFPDSENWFHVFELKLKFFLNFGAVPGTHVFELKLKFFLNFGAVPGTLFIYFVIFLTIHVRYSSSGCSPAGYSFFLSWVNDPCIWANNFLPAGPRVG
jgi:hypothetical protein